MPVAMVMEWDGVTAEQYEEARARVGWETDQPDGGILHVARIVGGTLHVLDVWETPEQFERFVDERLTPVTSTLGIETEPRVRFEPVLSVFVAERAAV